MQASMTDFVFFALVSDYLRRKLSEFQGDTVARVAQLAGSLALVLVTLWILIQGYRIVTGQRRESMMIFVVNACRTSLIVMTATAMGVTGGSVQRFLAKDLGAEINWLMTNERTSPAHEIDKNLAYTQLAMAAIDAVQVLPGDSELAEAKARASSMATLGVAGPPMVAGAMLLLYQFTIAIFIGLGPLFILCLLFDQTKDLFRKWLMYGIGTLFSLAMLNVVTTICLKLTIGVAAALWTADIISKITGIGAEGLSNQALQQGGIGLLMSVLIISVPPLAAAFFSGTVGSFMAYSAFGRNGGEGSLGQPGNASQSSSTNGGYPNQGHVPATRGNPSGERSREPSLLADSRWSGASAVPMTDQIKPERSNRSEWT